MSKFLHSIAPLLSVVIVLVIATNVQSQLPKSPATADAAAKQMVLESSRWRNMEAEFHEWLAIQVVYTPQQVAQIKARLAAEIQRMSAAELQQFLEQWDAKLKVLLGKDAAEAREWLGQFLSVAAAGYRKQVFDRLGISNVSSMSAAQIEDAIHNIRSKELHVRQERAVFDQGRALQVQSAQAFQSSQQEVLQRAGQSQAGKFGSYQTPLSPKQFDWRPRAPLIPWGGWW